MVHTVAILALFPILWYILPVLGRATALFLLSIARYTGSDYFPAATSFESRRPDQYVIHD